MTKTMTMTGKIRYMPPPLVCCIFDWARTYHRLDFFGTEIVHNGRAVILEGRGFSQ